jgi:hypothetical protein
MLALRRNDLAMASSDEAIDPYEAIALSARAVRRCVRGHEELVRTFDNGAERKAFAEVIVAFHRGDVPGGSLPEAVRRLSAVLDGARDRCRACGF